MIYWALFIWWASGMIRLSSSKEPLWSMAPYDRIWRSLLSLPAILFLGMMYGIWFGLIAAWFGGPYGFWCAMVGKDPKSNTLEDKP